MWANSQETVDLVIFTKEILSGKLVSKIEIASFPSIRQVDFLLFYSNIILNFKVLKVSRVILEMKGNCGFGHIYCRNPKWKTSFFVQWKIEIKVFLWSPLLLRKRFHASPWTIFCCKANTWTACPRLFPLCCLVPSFTLFFIYTSIPISTEVTFTFSDDVIYRNSSLHRKTTGYNIESEVSMI